MIRQVKTRHANAVVGHPIIDVETIRPAKVVTSVDASGKHNIVDDSVALLRENRSQHGLNRAIAYHARMLL